MKRLRTSFAFAIAMVGLGSMIARADALILRTGRSYNGELVSITGGRVEFRTDNGRTERFDLEDVDRIEFSSRDRDRAMSRPTGSERPAGLREREIEVASSTAWTRTPIELRDGQDVWFDSRGEVRWGPGRKDGPGGESGSPRNPARPMANRPGAALIGKIGESGDPFFIGNDKGPIKVRGRGTLFLGINDDYLQDNSGSFRVIVYY
jgi:hypothetical protein